MPTASDTVEQQALLNVAMSLDPEQVQSERARRNSGTLVTALATLAAMLAVHDLSLLVRLGR